MSRALIADYFEYAKNHGDDPAMAFYQNKTLSWIPHWVIRSKAKHFALGLLELNAPDEGYFYLFSHHHPEWVYALLAAQSLGLATVTVPPGTEAHRLDALLEKYPPSFIYGAQFPSEAQWKQFKKSKNFIAFIFGALDPATPGEFISSFRKIHNRGVMAESRFFQHYRQRRESLPEDQLVSPVQVDASQNILEHPLRAAAIKEKFQALDTHARENKHTQLFAQVDFSRTLDQVLGLYWPLLTGKRVALVEGHEHWLGLHPPYRPQLAFLSPEGVSGLVPFLSLGKTPLLQKDMSFWGKRRARKKLGGDLQEIWSTKSLGEETQFIFKKLGIRLWTVEL